MADHIFREKSLQKISSPEELNDYVKVANPGVWLLLGGIIVLIIGLFAWSILGKLDSTTDALGIVKDNELIVYVSENAISSVDVGTIVKIDDKEYSIESIDSNPIKLDNSIDEYKLHIGNLNVGDWVYICKMKVDIKNGIYPVDVVTERINPISLLFN